MPAPEPHSAVAAYLERFTGHPLYEPTPADTAAFGALALQVFAWQYERNEPYRRYCDALGARPNSVSAWREIPAVPTEAFRSAPLRTSAAPPVAAFLTSGTASGRRGRHEFTSLALYEQACWRIYQEEFTPAPVPPRMAAWMPPPTETPESSLSFMLGHFARRLCLPEAGVFHWEPGRRLADLRALAAQPGPMVLWTTPFAFIHVQESYPEPVPLPPGSTVYETGGYKGRVGAVAPQELHASIARFFGVPPHSVRTEYGMTELTSQFYGRLVPHGEGFATHFRVPPWMRVTLVDPVTGTEVPTGQPGLIQVFDLTNTGSVAAILTGDLGAAAPNGFVFLGRAPGGTLRGCSLTAAEVLGVSF